jgi:iron complex transport system ATP-binding protein
MTEAALVWHDVCVRRGGRTVLQDVSLRIDGGEVVAIVGPNGAGKSSLLRAVDGQWPLSRGTVAVLGRAPGEWDRAGRARRFAVLSQKPALAFDFLVEEVVALGRLPHFGIAGALPERVVVAAALAQSGLQGFERRAYLGLSAGEQQRVQCARVLAQLWELGPGGGRDDAARARDGAARGAATARGRHGHECTTPGALLLDEPTSALDLGEQQRMLGVAWQWSRAGLAVGIVMHDLNLAARFADRLVVLQAGRVVAEGPPRDVLTGELIERVYGCPVAVWIDPATGRPVVLSPGPRAAGPS